MSPTMLYVMLGDAVGNMPKHYANMNHYTYPVTHMSLHNYWQIDEATYNEFRDMLPPIYAPGGFFMQDGLCDHPVTGRAIHAYFACIQGTYWCGYAYKTKEGATAMLSVMTGAEWALVGA